MFLNCMIVKKPTPFIQDNVLILFLLLVIFFEFCELCFVCKTVKFFID